MKNKAVHRCRRAVLACGGCLLLMLMPLRAAFGAAPVSADEAAGLVEEHLESEDFSDFSLGLYADSSAISTQTNYLAATNEPIVLASAIDIYAQVFPLSDKAGTDVNGNLAIVLDDTQKADLNEFLTTGMGNGNPVVNTLESIGRKHEDRFDYRQDKDQDPVDSIERGLVEKHSFSKAALVVFTVEFTDFQDTHLRLANEEEKPESPKEGATYWVFDESSRFSTPYQGLEFSIKTITANGNK